jgi:hypothetical protein
MPLSVTTPTVANLLHDQTCLSDTESDSEYLHTTLQHTLIRKSSETSKDSRQQSVFSTEHTPESSPMTVPAALPSAALATPPATSHYVQPMASPVSMPNTLPRYTQDMFRTPQLPHTPPVQRTRRTFPSGSASFLRPVSSRPASSSTSRPK